MGRNDIRRLGDQTALTQQLKDLERQFQQYKNGVQAPTIRTSALVQAGPLEIYDSWNTSIGNHDTKPPQIIVKATLQPPTNEQILFAVPEVFLGTWDGISQVSNPFPEGSFFASEAIYFTTALLGVNWWIDWDATDDTNIVAFIMIRIDAGIWNAPIAPWAYFLLSMAVRWRYMVQGASL